MWWDELPKLGFTIGFVGDPQWKDKFFKIENIEGFEYQTGNTSGTAEFSTVASGGLSGFKQIEVLDPDKNKAVYTSMGFKDGCLYEFKVKAGTIRFGPDGDKNAARLSAQKSPWWDPDPTFGFWMVENYFPAVQARNVTPFTITPSVYFKGFKYDLKPVPRPGDGKLSLYQLGGVGDTS